MVMCRFLLLLLLFSFFGCAQKPAKKDIDSMIDDEGRWVSAAHPQLDGMLFYEVSKKGEMVVSLLRKNKGDVGGIFVEIVERNGVWIEGDLTGSWRKMDGEYVYSY